MSIVYPTTIDSLTNPNSTDTLDSPSHSDQHSDLNDAVEALEIKIGIDSSVDTDSLDYKVNTARTGSDTNFVTGTKGDSGDLSQWNGDGDLVAKTVVSLLGTIYPIGCIYISTVATNPNTLFGFGTWTAFGSGKVLVGIDSEDGDFDEAEETGGSKTHTLTAAEIPGHTHSVTQNYTRHSSTGTTVPTVGSTISLSSVGTAFDNVDRSITSSTTGSGGAHNNLSPYIVTYFFKRTA